MLSFVTWMKYFFYIDTYGKNLKYFIDQRVLNVSSMCVTCFFLYQDQSRMLNFFR